MKRIIKIANDIVFIGNADGSYQGVRLADCHFQPAVGDVVNVFSNGTDSIVTKIEPPKPANPADKIHINIVNENQNGMNAMNPQLVNGGVVVNKVIYCILALFFGCIGLHKMYAQKYFLSFIYFLFSMTLIPALIAFFEFLIALCKPSDANGNIVV